MKPFLLILFACGGLLAAHAEDPATVMTVTTSSGSTPITVTAQSKITFSDDNATMIVAPGADSDALGFSVDDITNIVFTITSGKIDKAVLDDLKISNEGKILTISGAETIQYAVWNVSGVLLLSGTAEESVSIDFNTLNSGVYIVKANKSTLKYINH